MSDKKRTENILIVLIVVVLLVSALSYSSISPIARSIRELSDSIDDLSTDFSEGITDISSGLDSVLTKLDIEVEPEPNGEEPEPEPTNLKRVLRSTWAFPTYIDPHVYTDGSSGAAQVNLYDSFIKFSLDGQIIPWLFKSWTASSDGLTWTISIEEGVKFHDGTDLTAEDVAFSLNRQLILGTGMGYTLVPHVYANITAQDDYTIQLTLKHSFGPLLAAMNGWYCVNKDLILENIKPGQYGEYGDFATEWLATNDAGSGSYMLKSYIMEEKLILEKFEDYWKGFADKAPDIVEMLATTEPITVRLMLANGELEYSDPWQSRENLLAIQKLPGIKIAATIGTTGNWNLMMNTKKPPLDCVHIRRAISYSLNYTKIVTELMPGYVLCRGPINHALLGFDPTIESIEQDMDKAREELALSKYATNYTDYPIELHWCAEVPDEEKVSMQLMVDCDALGIDIRVMKTPWTTMVAETALLETSPHMIFAGAGGSFPEAGSYFVTRYHSASQGTWQQNEYLLNATLDAMIEDALMTTDFDERMEKYHVIQRDLVEQCPTVWLYISTAWRAFPDYVKVYGRNPETGIYLRTADLGEIYQLSPSTASHAEFRLFEVDRLIEYGGQ